MGADGDQPGGDAPAGFDHAAKQPPPWRPRAGTGPRGIITGKNNQARWHARRAGRTAVLGIASTELALAYILCIVAAVVCVVYGVIKWNDAGPLTEELREINSDPGE